MNYYDLLKSRAEQYPEKAFVIYNDKTYTYRMIYQKCQEIRAGFFNLENQEVFVFSGNWLFQLTSFLAVQSECGVPILLHFPMPESSLCEAQHK